LSRTSPSQGVGCGAGGTGQQGGGTRGAGGGWRVCGSRGQVDKHCRGRLMPPDHPLARLPSWPPPGRPLHHAPPPTCTQLNRPHSHSHSHSHSQALVLPPHHPHSNPINASTAHATAHLSRRCRGSFSRGSGSRSSSRLRHLGHLRRYRLHNGDHTAGGSGLGGGLRGMWVGVRGRVGLLGRWELSGWVVLSCSRGVNGLEVARTGIAGCRVGCGLLDWLTLST